MPGLLADVARLALGKVVLPSLALPDAALLAVPLFDLAAGVGLVLLPVSVLAQLGLELVDLCLESVHCLTLPVQQLGGILLGLLLGDSEVDNLVVAGVLLDGSLLQLRAGGLHHDGVHRGLVSVVVRPVDELRGLPNLLVPRVEQLQALGVGVEELEHGARPVTSLLEGVLDLVHSLLVAV